MLSNTLTIRTLPAALALLASLVVAIPSASAGQIYVYKRNDGSRMVTDHVRMDPDLRLIRQYGDETNKTRKQAPMRFQIRGGQAVGVGSSVGSKGVVYTGTRGTSAKPAPKVRPINSSYDALISATANKHGVDVALVRAVVQVESAFRPKVVSKAGAMGLMQLMPATAARYGVSDRGNPRQNVSGGVRYLRDLLELFGENTELALAAYNAGEGAVIRYRGIPPYKETRNYVKKVMKLHQMYQSAS